MPNIAWNAKEYQQNFSFVPSYGEAIDRAYHEAAVSEKATPDGFRACAVGVRPL